jgi:uracil DNA glycosylase
MIELSSINKVSLVYHISQFFLRNCDKVHVLPPKKTTVFTWDNLQGAREVEWFILGQEKFSAKNKLEKVCDSKIPEIPGKRLKIFRYFGLF